MKKILFILLLFVMFSCSSDDDNLETRFELIAVESAEVPEEFILGNSYRIDMTYFRKTTCHAYNSIYFRTEGNERTVAVINTVFESNGNCEDLNTELEAFFHIDVLQPGSYVFKFWKGTDESGEDIYDIVEVPVLE